MKKLFFLFLIAPAMLFAQDKPDWEYDLSVPISAFFPQRLPITERNYVKTQNTYYEYNWVQPNLTNLIEKRLNLRFTGDVYRDGSITHIYKTKAGKVIDELHLKFNVFTYYGLYVVSSIDVTGSHAQVTKFFILLYGTDIQSGSNLVNNYVKNFGQETATYIISGSTAKVKIVNTVYKSTADFKANFEKLKEAYKNGVKATAVNDADLIEERSQEQQQWQAQKAAKRTQDSLRMIELQNEKTTKAVNMYYFTKGKNIEFRNKPKSAELESKIVSEAADLKRGKYSAYVTSYTKGGTTNYEIKFNQTDN